MRFRAVIQLNGKKLSNSHKQRWVLSITEAKTPQTRERRIAKAIEALRQK